MAKAFDRAGSVTTLGSSLLHPSIILDRVRAVWAQPGRLPLDGFGRWSWTHNSAVAATVLLAIVALRLGRRGKRGEPDTDGMPQIVSIPPDLHRAHAYGFVQPTLPTRASSASTPPSAPTAPPPQPTRASAPSPSRTRTPTSCRARRGHCRCSCSYMDWAARWRSSARC